MSGLGGIRPNFGTDGDQSKEAGDLNTNEPIAKQESEPGKENALTEQQSNLTVNESSTDDSAGVVSQGQVQVNSQVAQSPDPELVQEFFVAIDNSNLKLVSKMIFEGMDPNVKDGSDRNRTALHHAAAQGDVPLINLLVNAGAKLDEPDDLLGITPIFLAIANNHQDAFDTLLEVGTDLHAVNSRKENLVYYTAYFNRPEMMKKLIEHGVDFEAVNDSMNDDENISEVPLHIAAKQGSYEAAKVLIAAGADVNKQIKSTTRGYTPLHYAVISNHPSLTELLLENGAELECMDYLRQKPIHRAADSNSLEALEVLLEYGADFEEKELYRGMNAMLFAVANSNQEMVNLLLACGADPNPVAETPLYDAEFSATQLAMESGSDILFDRLVDEGNDLKQKNAQNETPLEYMLKCFSNVGDASRRAHERDKVFKLIRRVGLADEDLSRHDLSGLFVYKLDVSHHTNVDGTNFAGALFREVDLSPIGEHNLSKAKLEGARYDDTVTFPPGFNPVAHGMIKVARTDWTNVDMRNADLSQYDIRDFDFRGSDIRGVNFNGRDLRTAQFDSEANLVGCDLREANLSGQNMLYWLFGTGERSAQIDSEMQLHDCVGVPDWLLNIVPREKRIGARSRSGDQTS